MGDAENSLQSTRKRAAGREISRDNPGLDDEEDSTEQGTGTFKKASEDVLATRRIVKVRRQPQAPSSNPFAGIKLVATTAPTVTKPDEEKVSSGVDGMTNSGHVNEENNKESKVEAEAEAVAESKPEAEAEAESKPEAEAEAESKPEAEAEAESKAEAEEAGEEKEEDKAENDEKKDVTEDVEKKDESVPLNSFQQLSSSQNAFTNLSGTGFSTSTFSFGSIKSDGSGFGTGSGSGSGSLFGLKTDQPSFGLSLGLSNNGSSSLFGNSVVSKSETSSVPPMKEVEVETGEENEEAVFSADSVLYEFIGGGWKERGKGEVKLNVSKPEKEKARLVMRAKGNYRLILNASLYPDMKLSAMDKKGLSFACMNSTGEGSGAFSTFALKFRDPSIVEEFRAAVAVHKGSTTATAAVLKTPENSPKASDE